MSKEQFILLGFASFFIPLVISIPFWPRLLDRYEFSGIFFSFMSFGVSLWGLMGIFGVATSKIDGDGGSGFYVMMALLAFVTFIVGLFWLKTTKRRVDERPYSVINLALQGRWDLLERAGVPKREIEQLKQLTPQQRALTLAPLQKQLEEVVESFSPGSKKKGGFLEDDPTIFPGSLSGELECRIHPLGELSHERFGERHW